MTVQITVIGLGQIGTSLGLALGLQKERITRVGYDQVVDTQNKAKKLGAFDAVKYSLPAAVEQADVVLLCVPFDQVEETFGNIGPVLRENAVVLDFSPQKTTAYRWFSQHVPAGRHYIGLAAAVNPQMLELVQGGIDAADGNLFQKASVGIAVPQGTPAEAIQLAADLVEMIGGQAIFLDMPEADGKELGAHILPQVAAAALLNGTIGQPGWAETRRFAGKPYLQAASALGADSPEALAAVLMANPELSVHVINNVLLALGDLRDAIQRGEGERLQESLEQALAGRETWRMERLRAEWEGKKEAVSQGNFLKSFLFGDRSKKKK